MHLTNGQHGFYIPSYSICLQGSEGNFHMKRCEGRFHPPIHSDSQALVPKLAEDDQVSPTKTSCHLPQDEGWQYEEKGLENGP